MEKSIDIQGSYHKQRLIIIWVCVPALIPIIRKKKNLNLNSFYLAKLLIKLVMHRSN